MAVSWIDKAVLFEVLSVGLRFTTREAAQALVDGEYADALSEAAKACSIDDDAAADAVRCLQAYVGEDADAVFHAVRREYTRLFVGTPEAAVSPYAGIYYAEDKGVTPVLYVNTESMTVERFMKRCGVDRTAGTNEPLDHIATELEFLNYLCLVRAQAVQTTREVPQDAYEEFYRDRFIAFAKRVCTLLRENTEEPLFSAAARMVLAFPDDPL